MFQHCVIVGGGAIGAEIHLPLVLSVLHSDHVTVVEAGPARLRELSARWARDRRVSVVPRLPEGGEFDLGVIATPPKSHFDLFAQLKDRVRDLLIEKPMTRTSEEAQALVTQAQTCRARVYVNLVRRTLSSYPVIQAFRRDGLFGRLKRVEYGEGGVFTWQAVSMGSFSRELNGGGVLMDTGPHGLDCLLTFLDRLELRSATMDHEPGCIEANARLELVADEEVPVVFEVSRNRNLSNRCRVDFERATVSLGVGDNVVEVQTNQGASFQVTGNLGDLPLHQNPRMSYATFYERYLLNRQNEGVGPEPSAAALRLIGQAYQQAVCSIGEF